MYLNSTYLVGVFKSVFLIRCFSLLFRDVFDYVFFELKIFCRCFSWRFSELVFVDVLKVGVFEVGVFKSVFVD